MSIPRPEAPSALDLEGTAESPPRAWWQFSLRTMFVLVTLLSLALGWFFSGPERARRAVEGIRELGGQAAFSVDNRRDPNDTPSSANWRMRVMRAEDPGVNADEKGWLPKAYYADVLEVNLGANPKARD